MNKINFMKNIYKLYCLFYVNVGYDFKKYSGCLFWGDNCYEFFYKLRLFELIWV